MPIYEYDCPKCGRFDTLQRMSAPPLRRHEACGSPVKKVMSAGSFAMKGSHKAAKAPSCSAPRGAGCAGCPSAEA
ncbi:MAG: zinc ribbon domain-containing protein [Deltaproteobacteria bacterium]